MENFLISPCAGYLWCCPAERLGPALGVNPAVSERQWVQIRSTPTPAEWDSFPLRRLSGKDIQPGRGLSPLGKRKPIVNRLDFNSATVKMHPKWTGATIIIHITRCWAVIDWCIYILPGQAMPSEEYKPLLLSPLHQWWMQSLSLLPDRAAHIPSSLHTYLPCTKEKALHVQDSIFHFLACCINKLMTLLSVFSQSMLPPQEMSVKLLLSTGTNSQNYSGEWGRKNHLHYKRMSAHRERNTGRYLDEKCSREGTLFRWAAQVRAISRGAEKWRMFNSSSWHAGLPWVNPVGVKRLLPWKLGEPPLPVSVSWILCL